MNYYWYIIALTIGYYYSRKKAREAEEKIRKCLTDRDEKIKNS